MDRPFPSAARASVVFRFPNWIGDVMMALPVLDQARELWPDARIGVQVHPRGRTLLEKDPRISRLHLAPARGGPAFIESVDDLSAGGYDLGILLTPSFSSAWIFYLARIPDRAGWSGEARSVLLTRALKKPDRSTRLPGQYQDVLRAFGYSGPERELAYTPPPDAAAEAAGWLAVRGLERRPLAALAPAAMHGPAKIWPAARYRELARHLASVHGFAIVAIGSAMERPLLEAVAADVPDSFVLAGDLPLPAAAALIGGCSVLVGNDTGLLHVARAMRTPVVGIYGSTTPLWSGPAPREGVAVYKGVSCSPCFRRECPLQDGRLACLETIEVSEVAQAVDRLLAAPIGAS